MALVDVQEVKQRSRHAWGLGDYRQISRVLEPAAEALCEACAVSAGQEVLDVGAGDGNFALAAARRGARVTASDLSPVMVERGRARSEAERYEIDWLEADAEELPFEEGRFDCVGSVFGAMIAPRPEVVARELVRAARPGGTVGMTAWTPDSAAIELFSIGRKYLPPPPDLPLIEAWGEEETARGRFGELVASLDFERRTVTWDAESPDAFLAFEGSTPMSTAMRQALSAESHEAMRGEQLELLRRWAGGGNGPVSVEAEYLQIVARKRG
jgi:SAM-dependent methyltransferase